MRLSRLQTILRRYFRRQPHVCAAYLFGSQAKRKATAFSDVDIAVLLDATAEPSRYFTVETRLWSGLCQALDCRDVDLIILNRAGPFLRYQVYKTGYPVFERDRVTARRFMARSVVEFFDFEPIKNRLERAVLSRLGL